MKRLAIVFAVLFIFSASAYAQTSEGMKPEQQGQMGHGMMGREGKMPMMPMCQEMMKQQMGEGQQMPMMQMMGQNVMMQDMMQMMLDMMQMQKKMMKGVTPAEKKEMMMKMDKMHETMDKMMLKHMGMMRGMHTQVKMKCAEQWLKKAIDLHEIHIKDPKTATEASQMEMMEQMENAYKCITTGLETTETPTKIHEGEKTKREDYPKTEQHEHSH